MEEYKKGKSYGLNKELSAEGRVLMNREVEFLKEVRPLKEHKDVDRDYRVVSNYLTEGHAGHYWLTIAAERKRLTGKRGSESNQGGNSESIMMDQGPNKRQKKVKTNE
jgi:hypothetical protein